MHFWWNLTTTFITHDVPKFVHDITKNWGLRGYTGVEGGGVAPQNMYLLSILKPHTRFWWNLSITFITRDVQRFVHGIKKKNPEVFTFFSIIYFVDCPCLPVVAWLSYPATTRWAPRGIAPMFNVSVRFFVIIPVGPAITGTTLAFFSFQDLLTSFLRSWCLVIFLISASFSPKSLLLTPQ